MSPSRLSVECAGRRPAGGAGDSSLPKGKRLRPVAGLCLGLRERLSGTHQLNTFKFRTTMPCSRPLRRSAGRQSPGPQGKTCAARPAAGRAGL